MVLSTYDVIVVGGDPIGLFAAHQWARAGKKVLLLEQFEFFNERASSKGDSRFFRIIYADVWPSPPMRSGTNWSAKRKQPFSPAPAPSSTASPAT